MYTPSLVDLRTLDSAARCGSFSAAARELGVSQQAVSSRLRELERLLGLELVLRSPGGIRPTPAGEIVLARGREVLAAADRLGEAVAALGSGSGALLEVGASQTIASHLLPGWLLEWRRRRMAAGREPVGAKLHTANSETVASMVRDGRIDLGFIETPDPPSDLGSVVVGLDRMVVAVASDHPWAEREAVPLVELASAGLVAREEGSGTRAALDLAIRARLGAEPAPPLVELATEAAVRSAVAHGVGPAVLSEHVVRDDMRLGRIRALGISPDPLTRPLTAIWRGSPRDLAGTRRELVELAAAEGRADRT